MTTGADSLRVASANADVAKGDLSYRCISPIIGFGEGGVPVLERLARIDDNFADFETATNLHAIQTGGWVALEAATFLPPSRLKSQYLEKSQARFEKVAQHVASENWNNRYAAFAARTGLIAFGAYTEPVETVVDDNPGLYASILEDILADSAHTADTKAMVTIADHAQRQARNDTIGLKTEIIAATLISHVGKLVVPASVRHDMTKSIIIPNPRYDLSVWMDAGGFPTSTPTHHYQVKTNASNNSTEYANHITVVDGRRDLALGPRDMLAYVLIKLYNGAELNRTEAGLLARNELLVTELLRRPSRKLGDEYGLSTTTVMRGGTRRGSNRTTLRKK